MLEPSKTESAPLQEQPWLSHLAPIRFWWGRSNIYKETGPKSVKTWDLVVKPRPAVSGDTIEGGLRSKGKVEPFLLETCMCISIACLTVGAAPSPTLQRVIGHEHAIIRSIQQHRARRKAIQTVPAALP